jgi:hypothetical protein
MQKTKIKTRKVKGIVKKQHYTRKQKQRLANKIYDISEEDIIDDFNHLREIGCQYHKDMSKVGNNVVNKFTAVERLNATGQQRVSFYDLWKNRKEFKKVKSVKKMVKYYHDKNPDYPEQRIWFRISNLYYSSVSIFKPLIAMDIYCKYNPKCVLDFTMGWGGRLVGACALDIPKYIGIDNNKQLKEPYNGLCKFLEPLTKTTIQLYFQDALSIDYSKLDYDLVLTSPPYYNVEMYDNSREKTNEQWDTEFYTPLFTKTFKYLKKGGHYCLNIPNEVFNNVAIKILGKPSTKIPLPKSKRFSNEKYNEFIYVWTK